MDASKRNYISKTLNLDSWKSIEPYFKDLKNREIASENELYTWFLNKSELESYLSENLAWRYIKMTIDTQNQEYLDAYQFFVNDIQPHLAKYSDELNKKALNSVHFSSLNQDGFDIYKRSLKKEVEIFRPENIDVFTEIQTKQTQYQSAVSKLSVTINGEDMTLQKAATLLKSQDSDLRKEVWLAIQEARFGLNEELDALFTELLQLRTKAAHNAGFKNFRDYMFAAMGRFDYSPQDCFDFHESIEKAVMPLVNNNVKERKQTLNLEQLMPWDLKMDVKGREALKPFNDADELLQKTIQCFSRIDSEFGSYLEIMKDLGHFDLESKKGKSPGGYNYPLEETGIPFIFMNATSSLRDVVTMVHEGGHAIHSFRTKDLPINAFRRTPSEVAELASMAMELISMEHWDAFFKNKDELKRAKTEHLEDLLSTLPWVATIDQFQHWLYENPEHSLQERKTEWEKTYNRFSSNEINWKGLEKLKAYNWQAQLHIFEVPFYYIEYGMAQLGAIAVWKNYKQNPKKALNDYKNALSLGYTKNIKDIYQTANIRFDFSYEYIKELMAFVKEELNQL